MNNLRRFDPLLGCIFALLGAMIGTMTLQKLVDAEVRLESDF